MKSLAINIRFCGFGGQGIVLSAIVLGTAVVTRQNLYAAQTQSYGSEARGGQCQAELIISDKVINAPHADKKDILIALSQSALDRYISSLKPEGILIIDPFLVTDTLDSKFRTFEVAATEKAAKLGNKIAANMVLLGFLQATTGLITRDDLIDTVKETVHKEYVTLNLKAVDAGIKMAEGVKMEV